MDKTISIKAFAEALCKELFEAKIGPAKALQLLRGGIVKKGIITISKYGDRHNLAAGEYGYAVLGVYQFSNKKCIDIEVDFDINEKLIELSMLLKDRHKFIYSEIMLVENPVEVICKYMRPEYAGRE